MDAILRKIINEVGELNATGRTGEAIYELEQLAVEVNNLLGFTYLNHTKSYDLAEKYMRKALDIDKGNWIVSCNLCHVLNSNLKYEAALETAKRSIAASQGLEPDPYYNTGVVLGNMNRFEEAIEMYTKALEIDPNRLIAKYNMSAALLTLGQMEEGWKWYEWRIPAYERPKRVRWRMPQPDWDGTPLKGKKLLLINEQGVGDLFQFIRYIPLIKKAGGKVYLEAQQAAADLMGDTKADVVIPRGDEVIYGEKDANPYPEIDVVASICSLPYLLGFSWEGMPRPPYINVGKGPAPRGVEKDKLNVGICWAGNADHGNDCMRSCHLGWFRKLSEVPNVKLFSFQKGNMLRTWPYVGQVNLTQGGDGMELINLGPDLVTYTDTAKYIKHMDLIITVDTAIAHLAGAMNRPVWNLLAFQNDWRWMLNRSLTPWYPSMRLFRQPKLGDWESVFHEVVQELAQVQKPSDQPGKAKKRASKAS